MIAWDIVEHTKPPSNVPHKLCDKINANSTRRDQYYSCIGDCRILGSRFTRAKPWVIPISIESVSTENVNKLPLTINVHVRCYQLAGCTINIGGHFVTIVLWHGRPYFYNGIRSAI